VVFSSVTFLFYFLPIALGIYFLLSVFSLAKTGRLSRFPGNLFLLISSLFFYAWGEKLFVFVMLTSTLIDYLGGLIISGHFGKKWKEEITPLEKGAPRSRGQKIALTVSIVANLSILGFFKYFNFFVGSLNSAFGTLGLGAWQLHDVMKVALPVGISFYTFQSMSYTIDVYRGNTAATKSLLDFATFVVMFPQLVAGPIVRYRDVSRQLRERRVTLDDFSYGVRRFIIGLGKKVIVADCIAVNVDKIFAVPGEFMTTSLAWLGAVGFAVQLYFDFSGYSDMAIGLGRMLGFHFLENFNYPYISRSLREYWTRWHISLANWFRDYLYFPLGGNRRPLPRVILNLCVVFFLCGLWHGPSWTYVVWGMTHGLFLILERLGLEKWLKRLWVPLQHGYLLILSVCIKVIFRSETIGQAWDMLKAMAGLARGDEGVYSARLFLNPEFTVVLLAGVLGCLPIVPTVNKSLKRWARSRSGIAAAPLTAFRYALEFSSLALVFIWAIMWIANGTYNPFIYFRF
jgi:alginate O-acetyltransferase complex protein AlgI